MTAFDATPLRVTVFETPVLGALLRWFAVVFLWAMRWRTEAHLPDGNKWLLVVAPHTSLWDMPILVATALKHRVSARWLGKHTFFRGPFGPLFRWLGGIPVDPTRNGQGRAAQVIDVFNRSDSLRLAIAPEAGLSKVSRWRSGFYHIARAAEVPLVFGYVDFATRTAGAGGFFMPSGDLEDDFDRIRDFYRTKQGRHPERFSLPETPQG